MLKDRIVEASFPAPMSRVIERSSDDQDGRKENRETQVHDSSAAWHCGAGSRNRARH